MKDSLLLFGFTWKGTLLQVKLSETCVPGVWHVWNKLLCFNLTSFFAVAEQHIHFLFIPAATRKRRLCLLQLHESWFSCCLAWCVCKALQRWVQLATRHILLLLFPWFYCMPQYIFKKWGWWVSDHFQLQQGFIFAVCGWLKLDFVGPSSCVFAKTCEGEFSLPTWYNLLRIYIFTGLALLATAQQVQMFSMHLEKEKKLSFSLPGFPFPLLANKINHVWLQ